MEVTKLVEATPFFFTFLVMLGRVNQNQVWFSKSTFGVCRSHGRFSEVTKHVKACGLEEVLSLSQWEDCRQISVSIMLISYDLSHPIRSEWLGQIQRERERDVLYTEDPHSVGVWIWKIYPIVLHYLKHLLYDIGKRNCPYPTWMYDMTSVWEPHKYKYQVYQIQHY